MEGGFKTLAHLSVTSSSAVTMWSALCPCGASVVLLVGAALFLCGRRLGYAHHARSPGAGRVFDVFPQFLVQVVETTVVFPIAT